MEAYNNTRFNMMIRVVRVMTPTTPLKPIITLNICTCACASTTATTERIAWSTKQVVSPNPANLRLVTGISAIRTIRVLLGLSRFSDDNQRGVQATGGEGRSGYISYWGDQGYLGYTSCVSVLKQNVTITRSNHTFKSHGNITR